MRVRNIVVSGLVGVLLVGACGNSKSKTGATTTSAASNTPNTTASAADLNKNVPRPGVKGVTDSTIRVAFIASKTNPVGGKYVQMVDGIKAYFKTINDKGGIYGRKLEVVSTRDDIVGLQNSQSVTASLADDNAFATFLATLQFTGADKLAAAGQPTFTWNINPEFASNAHQDHSSIFASTPSVCFTCQGPLLPWLAQKNGFTKIGILAYGVSSESKGCAAGTRDAFAKYSGGKEKTVFFDDTIPFAGEISADVAKMKTSGVQFVVTCMDANEVVKLQKEMKKQGLNAIQDLPNSYDPDFLKANGALFEGAFDQVAYTPWEAEPQSPATKAFLAGITAITNAPVEVTEVGWIDAMQFVDALKGAGPEFTQQKVINWLNAQTAWSGDGLVQPINWKTGHIDPQKDASVRLAEQCMAIVQIKASKFVPAYYTSGKPWTCLDQSKGSDQPGIARSFAPGGVG